VIIGLVCGVLHIFPAVEMTPELILLVFLPALLFEASWNLNITELKQNWLPITILSTVGVLISATTVAFSMYHAGGIDLSTAFLFGAMISATDPISVLALFRKMGMDKRLTMILEGESLFNDGTAVVLFKLILALVISNAAFSLPSTIGNFFVVVLGGATVGTVIGYAASRLTNFFDDHLLEITLTTIVAYGSFLVSEQLQVSPVIAVLAAGIVLGNYGSRTAMSPTTRIAVNSFWEYAAFLVNSFVFLLIGLQVKAELLVKYAPLIGCAILATMLSRALVVYGLTPFVHTKKQPIPFNWRHLLYWSGLRGSLSMAMALSLPATLPGREAIVITTFGVVLFTLLVQGLTIEPLVKFLKVRPSNERLLIYQRLKARLVASTKATEFVDKQYSSGHISKQAHKEVADELGAAQKAILKDLDDMHLSDASLKHMESLELQKAVLDLKKDCYMSLTRDGVLTEELLSELRLETDEAIEKVLEQEVSAIETVDSNASQLT
jgi:monovalent cation:H+ antiporter, CPA1 family